MVSNFYNEDAPMPFAGLEEDEEPLVSGGKRRKMFFPGAAMGPAGYLGQTYPFVMGPVLMEPDDTEVTDPNP